MSEKYILRRMKRFYEKTKAIDAAIEKDLIHAEDKLLKKPKNFKNMNRQESSE